MDEDACPSMLELVACRRAAGSEAKDENAAVRVPPLGAIPVSTEPVWRPASFALIISSALSSLLIPAKRKCVTRKRGTTKQASCDTKEEHEDENKG
eukprot:449895-Rhodomonas_salina.2